MGIEDAKSDARKCVKNFDVKTWCSFAVSRVPNCNAGFLFLFCQGRKLVQTRLVEPVAASINSGDAYILVTDRELFQWLGKGANVIEKARVSASRYFI